MQSLRPMGVEQPRLGSAILPTAAQKLRLSTHCLFFCCEHPFAILLVLLTFWGRKLTFITTEVLVTTAMVQSVPFWAPQGPRAVVWNSPEQLQKKNPPKTILAFVTNLGDIYQLGDRQYHIFPPSPVTVWVWCVGQLGIRWPEPIFPEGHGDLTGTEWIPMGCAKQVAIGSCLHVLLPLSFISLEEQWCF